jgi:hypothetical protein
MFSEAQLIAFAMMVLGGVALMLTNGQARAASDQGSGAKDPHAMRAARA